MRDEQAKKAAADVSVAYGVKTAAEETRTGLEECAEAAVNAYLGGALDLVPGVKGKMPATAVLTALLHEVATTMGNVADWDLTADLLVALAAAYRMPDGAPDAERFAANRAVHEAQVRLGLAEQAMAEAKRGATS